MSNRKTEQDYHDLAASVSNVIEWCGVLPKNTHTKTKWICRCGKLWEAKYDKVRIGQSCYDCRGEKNSIKQRSKPKDYHKAAKNSSHITAWLGPEVKNQQQKTKWRCKCGNEYLETLNNASVSNVCPGCRYETAFGKVSAKVKAEYFHEIANNRDDIKYWIGPLPKFMKLKTNWMCICGNKFYAHYYNVKKGNGCPKCKSYRGEKEIQRVLDKHNVQNEPQKRFNTCRNELPLPFDFYLPGLNLLIEYQGEQHYKPVTIWGGRKALKDQQRRDAIKKQWAADNGYTLLVIPYTQFDQIEQILSSYIN